jgi:transcription-repair coupling factor (superfamily II helicase)
METLLTAIRGLPQYQELLRSLQAGSRLEGLGLPRATRLPVLTALHTDLKHAILFVTDRADRALSLHDELGFWAGRTTRYHFAEPNPLFYEDAAWGATTRRERLQALNGLALFHLPYGDEQETVPVITTSVRSLMTRTLPRREYLKACKRLTVGQEYQPESLLRSWIGIGYQREDTVLEVGQYSHRGGLLDIWPPAEPYPARLDFFGDELDTIRLFDPATQRTLEKRASLTVTPAREFIVPALPRRTDLPEQLSEYHLPLLHPEPSSLLDYLPANALVLVDDLSVAQAVANEVEEQAVKLRQESIQEGTLAAGLSRLSSTSRGLSAGANRPSSFPASHRV